MEEKNFLGLDGLKHFWLKAKTWIINRITTEVTAKIAEIIAEAPEDLDTLKEIADWISSHANDAAAMNTAILANTEAISGKADKSHTHTKSQITDFPTSLKNPNALTVNGKTYDGSEAVDAGVQTVANGGTGATTAKDAFMNLANGLSEDVNPIDTEHIIFKYTSGTNWGLYTLSQFWEYIKGKVDSIYAALSHTHTKSDVGLDKVDNTADSDKSVKYASSAGSVSWANVSDKPAYITGSYSNGVLNLYTN